ncbi:uncharacterized protein LOC121568961 [Coregonus clupeaformis]|uniref:uncharacterized protein LOC121568961 n=1 Tax=Coregonus clupeaformis TaxID=59861 RepID=UPI001BE0DA5B|nr:uncharacterized protein LOC121568961 [Coregonus clupeaformis]
MESKAEWETADNSRSLSGGGEERNPASKMSISGENNSDEPMGKIQSERPDSPVPSCVSLKSDQSKREPIEFREGPFQSDQRVQQERPDSPLPSGISMKSEQSKREPIEFRSGDFPPKQGVPRDQHEKSESESEIPNGQSAPSHEMDLSSIFELLEGNVITFVKNELKRLQRILCKDYTDKHTKDEKQESSAREGALKITLHVLRNMNQKELADSLEKRKNSSLCWSEARSS